MRFHNGLWYYQGKAYVLDRLQFWAALAVRDEEQLLDWLLQNGSQNRDAERKKRKTELRKAEKRKATVDALFVKMYEDWSAGRITESNFYPLPST